MLQRLVLHFQQRPIFFRMSNLQDKRLPGLRLQEEVMVIFARQRSCSSLQAIKLRSNAAGIICGKNGQGALNIQHAYTPHQNWLKYTALREYPAIHEELVEA